MQGFIPRHQRLRFPTLSLKPFMAASSSCFIQWPSISFRLKVIKWSQQFQTHILMLVTALPVLRLTLSFTWNGSNAHPIPECLLSAQLLSRVRLFVTLRTVLVFPVVMYRTGIWIINKAKHGRIDAFKLWCWRRSFRVPWTARRSNQSILKEINPGYSLEGLMLKLKLQKFGHLVQRADSLEKSLMLGKTEGKRRGGRQRMRRLDSVTNSVDMHLNKLWEIVEDEGAWQATVLGITKSWTWLSDWAATARRAWNRHCSWCAE